VVSDFFRQHRTLGMRERHTLAETTYTVLRQRLLYQHLAQSGRGEMERRLVLLGWQGNAAFLRAALVDGEAQWLEKVESVDRAALPERLRHNLPEWLAERLKTEVADDFWPLVESLNSNAPLDLRVNTFKAKREQVLTEFAAAGIEVTPTPYSPWGLRAQGKPALHKLDVFMRGDVEVQDEGSQLLALLIDAKRGEMVVDFCAGAGGKTLALGASMRNTGRLYAFDTSGHRLAALKPRLARSGLSNVHPVQIAHERDDRIKRLAGKIDRVLVDAPCSGLGTLRRNPDMKWRQSPEAVDELRVKQTAILNSAARLTKPGGRLVYATCSLLRAENEDIADAFCAEHARDFKRIPAEQVLADARVAQSDSLVQGPNLRLWPHRHGTDGFFASVWQRI
jgi:16S rRNA (cytosine967-C5)-methyltransferase